MTKFTTFAALHSGNEAFILPNAWDAQSAKIFEETGYPAVGTSSAAVAASLGYADGEEMPFSTYLLVIQRIAASVKIPVTIDIEMGYGETPEQIYDNLQKLVHAGVVGINIEDSVISDGVRSLRNAEEFSRTIAFIKSKLAADDHSLFINVRCDTFLLKVKDSGNETARRLKLYESAGADGIFLPFIHAEQDIIAAVASTNLPVNVMLIPGLADADRLSRLGVKRISMGPFFNMQLAKKAKELAAGIAGSRDLQSILQ